MRGGGKGFYHLISDALSFQFIGRFTALDDSSGHRDYYSVRRSTKGDTICYQLNLLCTIFNPQKLVARYVSEYVIEPWK